MTEPILVTPDHASLAALLQSIVRLHATCIETDHTLATFHPPLNEAAMLDWWRERMAEVQNKHRHIIVQLASSPGSDELAASAEVIGVVSLSMPWSETGPHRGFVEKLFTSPAHRQQGLARRLMKKLEELARAEGRTLLATQTSQMVDTVTQSPANMVYPRLGYVELGIVPNYGISPHDKTTMVDETFFWKDLRKSTPL